MQVIHVDVDKLKQHRGLAEQIGAASRDLDETGTEVLLKLGGEMTTMLDDIENLLAKTIDGLETDGEVCIKAEKPAEQATGGGA